MISSVEDILQSRSIHELRDLVHDLDRESKTKQSELQQMVGSTYLDFIQSADAISDMRKKAELMDQQLASFGALSQDIVDKTKFLLDQSSVFASKSKTGAVSTAVNDSGSNVITPWRFHELDSSSVWSYLDNCNIFKACQILVFSESVVRHCGDSATNTKTEPHSSPILDSLLEGNAKAMMASLPGDGERCEALWKCAGVRYLRETVIDDCEILLLYGNLGFDDAAKVMAGVAGLDLSCTTITETVPMDASNLLSQYLRGVECRIKDMFPGMIGENISEDDSHEHRAVRTADSLAHVVRLLQRTVMDIYTIFFHMDDDTTQTISHPIRGLFGCYLREFLESVVGSQGEFDWANYGSTLSAGFSQSTVLSVWREWIAKQTESIQHACEKAFAHMKSATEVARLQRVTLHECLGDALAQSDGAADACEKVSLWDTACRLLLRQSSYVSSSSGTDSSGGMLLWSAVFRDPFIAQVKRLLKVSCRDVFNRTRRRIVRTMSRLGVLNSPKSMSMGALRIDPHSLKLSFTVAEGFSQEEEYQDVTNWKWAEMDMDPQGPIVSANSSDIFVSAEKIRRFLDTEISSLVEELFAPSHSCENVGASDPESLYTLTRALQVQSCELIGQLIVLLRTLLQSCLSSHRQLSEVNSTNKHRASGHSTIPSVTLYRQTQLRNCILFVCRFAWLLKTPNGQFLDEALSMTPESLSLLRSRGQRIDPSTALRKFQVSTYQYMTSYDQLQSAFDIADTDGDGYVTFEEAVEAVQALWISPNSGDENGGPPNLDFLWFDATAGVDHAHEFPAALKYSIDEFRLVCAQMVCPPTSAPQSSAAEEDVSPSSSLNRCLDSLMMSSLSSWAGFIVDLMKVSLQSSMVSDFPLGKLVESAEDDGLRQRIPFGISPFTVWWKSREVDLGDTDEGEANKERVHVPTCPSPAVFRALAALNRALSSSFLSVDTTQRIPNVSRLQSSATCCLLDSARDIIFEKGLDAIVEGMHDRHRSLSEITPRISSGNSDLLQKYEDYCLQVVFDAQICEKILLSPYSQSSDSGNSLKSRLDLCRTMWHDSIDPINTHLLVPLMEEEVSSYIRRCHLLLPHPGDYTLVPLKKLDESLDTQTTLQSMQQSLKSENTDTALSNLFAKPPSSDRSSDKNTSRFSLLPLPVSFGNSGGKRSNADSSNGSTRSIKSNTMYSEVGVDGVDIDIDENVDSGGGLSGMLKGFKAW